MKTTLEVSGKTLSTLCAGAALALCTNLATADIIFTPTPGSNVGTDNVVFNPCSGITTTGFTVTGCLNSSTSTIIGFTSDETLVVNGGQARIEAADGAFNDLSIFVNPLGTTTFTSIIFNINTDAANNTGDIVINVQPEGEPLVSQTFSLANGQNFFRIDAINNEAIEFVFFESTVGMTSVLFDDVRQVRIGGVDDGLPPVLIPEPGTLALVGLTLAGLAGLRRKKV